MHNPAATMAAEWPFLNFLRRGAMLASPSILTHGTPAIGANSVTVQRLHNRFFYDTLSAAAPGRPNKTEHRINVVFKPYLSLCLCL
jgi:hypothetical protein